MSDTGKRCSNPFLVRIRRYCAGALIAFSMVPAVNATLINGDFLSPGDGLLVTDTATELEWLSSVYTSGHPFDDAFVQSLITTYGFRYATANEALNMINSNFANPPSVFPGTVAGWTDAQNFFNVFGITKNEVCGGIPCPRNQGRTSGVGSPGTHLAFGMIQFGSTGYALENLNQFDATDDPQVGSWLVKAAAIPEPATLALLGVGLAGLGFSRRRKSN